MVPCVDKASILLQNIHNHVCTSLYGSLTQTTLWILTTVSTSDPVPNIIKNWNIDGNVTLGKLKYRLTVFSYVVFSITFFFHLMCTPFYITCQESKPKPLSNSQVREKTNKMQQLDVYYQYFLNMFRASLCPSSGEQDVCYCTWCAAL